MGLDMRVISARNSKQMEEDNFWSTLRSGFSSNYNEPRELIYWRKFWDLYRPMAERLKIDNGEYAQLSKEDVEFMLEIATHHRDYFNTFDSVAEICELLDRFDEIEEHGMHIYFEGDY